MKELWYIIGNYLYEGELSVQDTKSVETFEIAAEICECHKCPDISDVSNYCRHFTK
jgi:hypothetical protein